MKIKKIAVCLLLFSMTCVQGMDDVKESDLAAHLLPLIPVPVTSYNYRVLSDSCGDDINMKWNPVEGTMLAIAGEHYLNLCDLREGKVVKSYVPSTTSKDGYDVFGSGVRACQLAWNSDGSQLAVMHSDGTKSIFDMQSSEFRDSTFDTSDDDWVQSAEWDSDPVKIISNETWQTKIEASRPNDPNQKARGSCYYHRWFDEYTRRYSRNPAKDTSQVTLDDVCADEPLMSHLGRVNRLAWNPQGTLLASASGYRVQVCDLSVRDAVKQWVRQKEGEGDFLTKYTLSLLTALRRKEKVPVDINSEPWTNLPCEVQRALLDAVSLDFAINGKSLSLHEQDES